VPEDPSVAVVEALLDGVATRLAPAATPQQSRATATHLLWICACVTMDDAPTWLIYEDSDGELVWGRIPDGHQASDVVDARFVAGGHADPGGVLAWLQGETPDPCYLGDTWGDEIVLSELIRKIRAARHQGPG
jgi:hypothetical protein